MSKNWKSGVVAVATEVVELVTAELGSNEVSAAVADEVVESAVEMVEMTEAADFQIEELSAALEAAAVVPMKMKKKVKTVKTGVGDEILMHIARGELDNKGILAAVLAADPRRKTSYACVAWYQSKVKAGMIDLPVLEVAEEEESE